MFSVDRIVPANADLAPGVPALGRSQIWAGLVLKAEEAVPLVPAMTHCHVTGRFENGLFRDIVFNGEAMTEEIIYHLQERIEFIRTSGIEMGTIINEILEIDDGVLHLRFAFTLERKGFADDSKKTEFAESMARSYLIAVQATVEEIRKRVVAGELAA